MSAPTVTRITDFFDKSNARERRIGQLTGPTAYETGGVTLNPEQLALSRIDILHFEPATNGTVIIIAEYEVSTKKVKYYDMTGAEQGNGTDLSTYTCRFEAVGK